MHFIRPVVSGGHDPFLSRTSETMKIDNPSLFRRPPSFRALNDLIARRKRLRQRVGLALAVCLPLGWLLLHVE
jgi:hypothetical protein